MRTFSLIMNFNVGWLIVISILTAVCSCAIFKTSPYRSINGHRVHYQTEGNGPIMVLAHGGYLDLEIWKPQMRAFKDDYTLLRFSDLGHGQSQTRGDSAIFGYQIIHALAAPYADSSLTLVGLSWGAMLCVDYALRYPERVRRLVLVSPGLDGWAYFQDSLARRNYELRAAATQRNNRTEAARLFHKNWVVGPRRNSDALSPDFYHKSLAMIERNMQEHWQQSWSALSTPPAIERLGELHMPVDLVIGAHDAEDILMIAEVYHQAIPHARLWQMDDAAHLLTWERAEKFNTLLREILAD